MSYITEDCSIIYFNISTGKYGLGLSSTILQIYRELIYRGNLVLFLEEARIPEESL